MIIARADITLTIVNDIVSVVWYYKLQSSTLDKPAKPTTETPPDGWEEIEPSYTAASTNSLYTTCKTIFTNGTFSYSEVSLSTAYEAAKEAYNKAYVLEQSAIVTMTEYYATTTEPQTVPADNQWSTTAPDWQDGVYVWKKVKITTANGTVSWTTPVNVSGATGATGSAITIVSAITMYAASDSATVPPSADEWQEDVATTDGTKRYLWTRVIVTYSDGTSNISYSVSSNIDSVLSEIQSAKDSAIDEAKSYADAYVINDEGKAVLDLLTQKVDSSDYQTTITDLSNQITATSSSINIAINKAKQEVNAYSDGQLNNRLENIDKHFDFTTDGLTISASDSGVRLNLDNDKVGFVDGEKDLAYFSDDEFNIDKVIIETSLTLGNFAFVPRANGSLDFKKVR